MDRPVTRTDVEASLRAAGVTSGSTVIVHCSLSELGWVVGNAVAVVRALRSVVGDDGTIVMPHLRRNLQQIGPIAVLENHATAHEFGVLRI